jgi:hypothetical protein
MATYIPEVQGVIPQFDITDLDYNRIERLLRLREGLYAKGAKKVKNLYETAFNSALTREGNIKKRDEYLKSITEGLQAVSAMDLSLDQNQQIANTLFEPVLSDTNLIKDIVATRSVQSEKASANDLRTSDDPKKRNQYWSEGVRALDYWLDDFKNASDEEALNMSTPKYTPKVDILGMADQLLKDNKINVKKDILKGGYIWTMKNGEVAVPIAESFVATMFAQDPAIKDALRTEAYVKRKDYIAEHLSEFGGDKQLAENAYIKTVIADDMNRNKEAVLAENKEVSQLRNEVASWEKVKKEKGIITGSNEETEYEAAKQKLELAESMAMVRRGELMMQTINDMTDRSEVINAIDNAVTMTNYSKKARGLAEHIAYRDEQVTAKVDPLYAIELRNKLAGDLEMFRNKNRVNLAILRGNIQSSLLKDRQAFEEYMEEIETQNQIKVKKTPGGGTTGGKGKRKDGKRLTIADVLFGYGNVDYTGEDDDDDDDDTKDNTNDNTNDETEEKDKTTGNR